MTRSRLPICPECGEPNPRPRTGGIGQKRSHSAQTDYRCVNTDCGHEFDSWQLEYREPRSSRDPSNSDDADALLEADPDDLVTDGGEQLDELLAKRYEAEEFWAEYDIPFEHDTCIKVRRSGLLRGSSGTGHAADTVVHLHVKEPFSEGRLTRGADAYLCEKGSTVDFQGREERHRDGDGGRYRPKVTCETCLDRMDRWQVDEHDLVTDGGPKPERQPQAFVVRCVDCDFESETHQRRETARKVAEGHERQAHSGRPVASIDAVEFVADGGVRYEPTEAALTAGTVVVDLASGQALQVVSVATQAAGEHPQTRSDPTADMFGADADEPVYNCVFLPDGEKVTPPTKTYAYPESRLLRYPVERATDGVALQTHLRAAMLEQLVAAAKVGREQEVVTTLARDAFGDDVADLLADYGTEVSGDG